MSIDEAYRDFANAIVAQAAEDWRRLCKGKKAGTTFEDLRTFFKSEWCADLCGELDPSIILAQLEAERTKPYIKKRKKT